MKLYMRKSKKEIKNKELYLELIAQDKVNNEVIVELQFERVSQLIAQQSTLNINEKATVLYVWLRDDNFGYRYEF